MFFLCYENAKYTTKRIVEKIVPFDFDFPPFFKTNRKIFYMWNSFTKRIKLHTKITQNNKNKSQIKHTRHKNFGIFNGISIDSLAKDFYFYDVLKAFFFLLFFFHHIFTFWFTQHKKTLKAQRKLKQETKSKIQNSVWQRDTFRFQISDHWFSPVPNFIQNPLKSRIPGTTNYNTKK